MNDGEIIKKLREVHIKWAKREMDDLDFGNFVGALVTDQTLTKEEHAHALDLAKKYNWDVFTNNVTLTFH